MAMSAKVVLPAFIAAVTGFLVGWWLEFRRLVQAHRPNGCDGTCLFLAGEYYDDALWVGVVGALVCGLLVFGLAVLALARLRPEPPEAHEDAVM
jgi:hypothetical protein